MSKTVEVKISPYIPISPDLSSTLPVNGYFEINIQYNSEVQKESNKQNMDGKEDAYQNPTIILEGFVKEGEEDTSALFNTSDEFSVFVNSLQFDDTEMYHNWMIVRPDESNQLKIIKKTTTPLKEDFVCSLHSLQLNATNLKGEDGRAVLSVKAEYFKQGITDEYAVFSRKVYISDVLCFESDKNKVKINEIFTLKWNCRGDYVNSAQLQANEEEPEAVAVSGSHTRSVMHPTMFKLMVQSHHPDTRFSATAYQMVEMTPPVINFFKADKTYVYNREKATLYWEADSANFCQINGGSTPYKISDQLTVEPEFESGEDKSKAEYFLKACGYNGQEPYFAEQRLYIHRTWWEEVGEITGVDLSKSEGYQPKGIYHFEDKIYLFDGTSIYLSEKGLLYSEVSKLQIQENCSLNPSYKCGFCNGNFYIAGVQNGSDIYMTHYDIAKKEWHMEWVSEFGENFLNGCFAADECNNRFYYSFFVDKEIFIYQNTSDKWSLVGNFEVEKHIIACDSCFWGNNMYFSISCEDEEKTIITYYMQINERGGIGDVQKQSVIFAQEQEISLVTTDNYIFLLGKQMLYDVRKGSQCDICFEKRLFTGEGSEPLMICKEDGKVKLYQLHAKEM